MGRVAPEREGGAKSGPILPSRGRDTRAPQTAELAAWPDVKKVPFAKTLLQTKLVEFNCYIAGTIRATKGYEMDKEEQRTSESSSILHGALAAVNDALAKLRYGAIQITVHDGKVMQIDVTERKRLHD